MSVLDDLRRNAKKRSDLTVERDALIMRAKSERVPVVQIASAVGLTRQQVHRIITELASAVPKEKK